MRNALIMFAALTVFGTLGCAKTTGEPNRTAKAPAEPVQGPIRVVTPEPHSDDNTERISLADAKKEFDAGTAVFIDVRGADAYKQEHITGALNITLNEIDANLSKLPKGKKIVVYCS